MTMVSLADSVCQTEEDPVPGREAAMLQLRAVAADMLVPGGEAVPERAISQYFILEMSRQRD
jgi:hypothetical protein